MRVPRTTLGGMAILVVFLAVNLALLRNIVAGGNNEVIVEAQGIIITANLVGLGLRQILLRRRSSPFLIGFEAAGLISIALYIIICRFHFLWLFESLYIPVIRFLYRNTWRSLATSRLLWMPFFPVLLSLPQILFAVIGGWVARGSVSLASRCR
jgi:hypothetical protein